MVLRVLTGLAWVTAVGLMSAGLLVVITQQAHEPHEKNQIRYIGKGDDEVKLEQQNQNNMVVISTVKALKTGQVNRIYFPDPKNNHGIVSKTVSMAPINPSEKYRYAYEVFLSPDKKADEAFDYIAEVITSPKK